MRADVSNGLTVTVTRRCAWARPGVFAASLVIACGLVPTAMAQGDSGEHSFFQEQFRQMQEERSQQPVYRTPATVPLTIRRSAPREVVDAPYPRIPARRAPARVAFRHPAPDARDAAAAPLTIHASAKPAPSAMASVFEDRTLRRGDVVIMSQGPRIFAGSQQFPYADKDFVAVRSVPGVAKAFRRDLDAIANNPYQHI